jgi:hypothetical protein
MFSRALTTWRAGLWISDWTISKRTYNTENSRAPQATLYLARNTVSDVFLKWEFDKIKQDMPERTVRVSLMSLWGPQTWNYNVRLSRSWSSSQNQDGIVTLTVRAVYLPRQDSSRVVRMQNQSYIKARSAQTDLTSWARLSLLGYISNALPIPSLVTNTSKRTRQGVRVTQQPPRLVGHG